MKRFTETNKWSDPWFQSLPHGSKLLFLYLCDKCDNAGFYEENVDEACFHLKVTPEQYKGAMKGLDRGLAVSGGYIWVKRFLKNQKNLPLREENPAHRQIILLINQQLERFNKNEEFCEFIAPLMGLQRGTGNGKGKVKVIRGSEEGVQKTADEIIEDLSKRECYKHINVRIEWGKMEAWCQKNKKLPTGKRFVNWLNRIDQPLHLNGNHKPAENRNLNLNVND